MQRICMPAPGGALPHTPDRLHAPMPLHMELHANAPALCHSQCAFSLLCALLLSMRLVTLLVTLPVTPPGVVTEYLRFGQAEGGVGDVAQLDRLLRALQVRVRS